MRNALRLSLLTGVCILVSACSGLAPQPDYVLNTDFEAQGQSSRIRHIVIHYTSSPFPVALKTLTEQDVSSHYLISDTTRPVVYQLVDENRRAWHAGLSSWYDYPDINTSSIGIELVNEGRRPDLSWAPYTPQQVDTLIALLRDLVAKHAIAAEHIVGHSDIAPQRKIDPGPLFPWEQLAQAGLGRWFDAATAQHFADYYAAEGLPSALESQQLLQQIGYRIDLTGLWDDASINVLRAFQMHYRPARYDGILDTETAGILRALQQGAAPNES